MTEIKAALKTAKALFTQKAYTDCIEKCNEALKLDPENFNLLLLKGACLESTEEYHQAYATLFKATQVEDKVAPWLGLFNICTKIPDLHHQNLVRIAIRLLSQFDTQLTDEKRRNVLNSLLECLTKHRLEMPKSIFDYLDTILTLSDMNDIQLDMKIRFELNKALVSLVPWKINENLYDTKLLVGLIEAVDLDHIPEKHGFVRETVKLAKIVVRFVDLVNQLTFIRNSDLELMEDLEQMLTQEFSQEGSLGITEPHVLHMLSIIFLLRHDYVRCENQTRKLLAYLQNQSKQASQERILLETNITESTNPEQSELILRPARQPIRSITHLEGEKPLIQRCICLLLSNSIHSGLEDLCESAALTATANSNFTENDLDIRLLMTECWLMAKRPDFYSLTWNEACVEETLTGLEQATQTSDKFKFLRPLLVSAMLSETDQSLHVHISALYQLALAYQQALSTANLCKSHDLFLLVKAAKQHLDIGHNLNEPINLLMNAIRIDANYWAPLHLIGSLFEADKRTEYVPELRLFKTVERLALQAYKRAQKLMPAIPICVYDLARLYCQLNQFDEALQTYESIESGRFTTEMFRNYGLVNLRLGNSAKSVQALQKVVLAEPNSVLNWEMLAQAYLERGSYETALKSLQNALNIDPDSASAHLFSGIVYGKLNLLMQAEKSFKRVIKLPNKQTSMLAFKGLIELKKNECIRQIQEQNSGQFLLDLNQALEFAEDCVIRLPRVLLLRDKSLEMVELRVGEAVKLADGYLATLMKLEMQQLTTGGDCALVNYLCHSSNLCSNLLARLATCGKQQELLVQCCKVDRLCHSLLKARQADIERIKDAARANPADSLARQMIHIESKIWHNSALLRYISRERDLCIEAICQALLISPNSLKSCYILAKLLLDAGDFGQTDQIVQHCLGLDPQCGLPEEDGFGNAALLKLLLQAANFGTTTTDLDSLVHSLFAVLRNCQSGRQNVRPTFLRIAVDIAKESVHKCLGFKAPAHPLWHKLSLLTSLSNNHEKGLEFMQKSPRVTDLEVSHELVTSIMAFRPKDEVLSLAEKVTSMEGQTEDCMVAKSVALLLRNDVQGAVKCAKVCANKDRILQFLCLVSRSYGETKTFESLAKIVLDENLAKSKRTRYSDLRQLLMLADGSLKHALLERVCTDHLSDAYSCINPARNLFEENVRSVSSNPEASELILSEFCELVRLIPNGAESRGLVSSLVRDDPTNSLTWTVCAFWFLREKCAHQSIDCLVSAHRVQQDTVMNRVGFHFFLLIAQLICKLVVDLTEAVREQTIKLTDEDKLRLKSIALDAAHLFPDAHLILSSTSLLDNF
ncbi:hypothetical protein Ciccas_007049 [Cichlidogyrus casuarinus]|uniref:Tetratricopeptide repeat protein n=1 Tax=Cichlidogyrus casuarinus TaxID=1844966 RepID=A0ABD2Q438_9PLAT